MNMGLKQAADLLRRIEEKKARSLQAGFQFVAKFTGNVRVKFPVAPPALGSSLSLRRSPAAVFPERPSAPGPCFRPGESSSGRGCSPGLQAGLFHFPWE